MIMVGKKLNIPSLIIIGYVMLMIIGTASMENADNFNGYYPSDGDNVYHHHTYTTEQSSRNKITNVIRSISHSLQKWYHGIQSRQFSENTIGIVLTVGTISITYIAYRIAQENADNEITNLKRKLASSLEDLSSSEILTKDSTASLTSLSTRIGSIEEFIDTLKGIGSCTYLSRGFGGNSDDYLLSNQPTRLQVNFKSCRRRCYESEGCNYWSYVTEKNENVSERKKCYLYSNIDGEPIYESGKFSGEGPHICQLSIHIP